MIKKRIVLVCTLSTLIILFIVGMIYQRKNYKNTLNNNYNDANEIPTIKENYNEITFKELKKTNNSIIEYNHDDNEIIDYRDDGNYIIGEYGKLYTTPIKKEYNEQGDGYVQISYYNCGNYSIYYQDDSFYYVNNITNEKSEFYYSVVPVFNNTDDFTCRYMILNKIEPITHSQMSILDTKENTITSIDSDIKSITSEDVFDETLLIAKKNSTNLVACNFDNKCRIIDYMFNTINNKLYEEIYIEESNLFIAKSNGKYGIIDKYDKVLLDIKYDGIEIHDNYIVVIKNDKLGVLDRNYNIIVDYEINYNIDKNSPYRFRLCCSETNSFYAYEKKGELFLQVLPSSDYFYDEVHNDELFEKYCHFYIIDKNGIVKIIKGLTRSYETDEYFAFISIKNDLVTYSFYDDKFNLVSIFNQESTHKELDLIPSAYHINRNYWKLDISYGDLNITNDVSYVDIVNKETVTELDTRYYYFENGYAYSFDEDSRKLNIYKKKEILNSYSNIYRTTYIGDYMFIVYEGFEKCKIIKLEFNKESK